MNRHVPGRMKRKKTGKRKQEKKKKKKGLSTGFQGGRILFDIDFRANSNRSSTKRGFRHIKSLSSGFIPTGPRTGTETLLHFNIMFDAGRSRCGRGNMRGAIVSREIIRRRGILAS